MAYFHFHRLAFVVSLALVFNVGHYGRISVASAEASVHTKFVCPIGTKWNSTAKSCELLQYPVTVLNVYNINVQEMVNPICCEDDFDVMPSPENIIKSTTIRTETVKSTTTESHLPTTTLTPLECCTIISPRVCKIYGKKWVCFNKRIRKCQTNICLYPVIYLKTPMVVYEPPILVMPPNPPLKACITASCDDHDLVDCSGCSQNIRETCSSYCYYYICPEKACGFLDLEEYCRKFPGDFACQKSAYGCIWDWCNTNSTSIAKDC